MPSIGWPELLIVLVIALVIFGPKRLPEMGRQLGRGLREFKKATNEIQGHFDLSLEDKDDDTKKTPAEAPPAAAATVPLAEASVAPVAAAETAGANAPEPVDAGAPVAVDAEAPVAVDAEAPAAVDAEAPEVIEGEVVSEEADHPAQTVAG